MTTEPVILTITMATCCGNKWSKQWLDEEHEQSLLTKGFATMS
jgi:hypothetical protein